jgi:alpha-glucan, water dikinase
LAEYITQVWASKWNERAYFSTRKVKLDHDYLSMAVLVQEVVSADYAFVIHTTNPSSGDDSEIYAEVVKGLGETLVGAYPGRALSFVCKKDDLNSTKINRKYGLPFCQASLGKIHTQSIIHMCDRYWVIQASQSVSSSSNLSSFVPTRMERIWKAMPEQDSMIGN